MARLFKIVFGSLVVVCIIALTEETAHIKNNIPKWVESENEASTSTISSTSIISSSSLSSISTTSSTSTIFSSTISTTTRRACNASECGPHAISCDYDFGPRECSCNEGYAARKRFPSDDETCERCLCDDSEKTCTFVFERYDYDSRKKCECERPLVDIHGECRECDCGPNSIDCQKDSNGNKQCKCDTVYVSVKYMNKGDEQCKKCVCGKYGTSCSFDTNNTDIQTCYCDYGGGQLITESGKCKECDCGIHSYSCDYEDGYKKCSCVKGYVSSSPNTWTDEICKSTSPEQPSDEGTSGWKVGFYISAVVFATIIIGLLIVIINRSRN